MRAVITQAAQVAEILRGRRRARRIPQQELANKLGISQSRLSAIESGSSALTLERLVALANLLDLQLVVQERSRKAGKPTDDADW